MAGKRQDSNFGKQIAQAEKMDREAWEVICAWPDHVEFSPIFQGLDYSELSRWFLWDKVGRSFRARFADEFEFEIGRYQPASLKFMHEDFCVRPRFDRFIKSYLGFRKSCKKLRNATFNMIYVPFPNKKLDAVIRQLINDQICKVVIPSELIEAYPGAYPCPDGIPAHKPNFRAAAKLTQSIIKGLRAQDAPLIAMDEEILKQQVRNLFIYTQYVRSMLAQLRPAAVLVHADNHPPYQPFVLEANRRGILSLCVQHGLDCENFYLDRPYARAIALWGSERKNRYQEVPNVHESYLEVTGNPAFDGIDYAGSGQSEGKYILWLTRPHTPDKCLSPSRHPREGLEILMALNDILSQREDRPLLYIRPHPADYIEIYSDFIDRNGLQDKVKLANGPLEKVISNSWVVICEDSTAGLEALIAKKPLILAHFAKSKPRIPFIECGVAKPAWDSASLAMSLREFEERSARTSATTSAQRQKFISEHAGILDNEATGRVCHFFYRQLQNVKFGV